MERIKVNYIMVVSELNFQAYDYFILYRRKQKVVDEDGELNTFFLSRLYNSDNC